MYEFMNDINITAFFVLYLYKNLKKNTTQKTPT